MIDITQKNIPKQGRNANWRGVGGVSVGGGGVGCTNAAGYDDSALIEMLNKCSEALAEYMLNAKGLFLSKKDVDSAAGLITMLAGVAVGDYVAGVSGAAVDGEGNAEIGGLIARGVAVLSELMVGDFVAGKRGAAVDGEGNAEVGGLIARGVAVLSELMVGDFVAGKRGAAVDGEGNAEVGALIARDDVRVGDSVTVGDFKAGALGSGLRAMVDRLTGISEIEVDNLTVRRKATFREVVIEQLRHIGGELVLSPASMIIYKVEDKGTYWRCYFDRGECDANDVYEVVNHFSEGAQVRCQMFTGLRLRYYWRLVVGVGVDYIDVSVSDCDAGSDAPAIGDNIAQFGHRDDIEGQNVILLSSYGADAPSIKQYRGIKSYSVAGCEVTCISADGNRFVGDFRIESTGESVADELNKRKTHTLVLDNEMASVACDSEGGVIGELPACGFVVYEGVVDVTADWSIAVSGEGADARMLTDKAFEVTALIADNATITVIASKPGADTLKKCMSISKVRAGVSPVMYGLYVVKGGMMYRKGQGYVATLQGSAVYKGVDIIDSYDVSQLVWTRESENELGDVDWNLTHRNIGSELVVTTDDMVGKTAIVLSFYNGDGTPATTKKITF